MYNFQKFRISEKMIFVSSFVIFLISQGLCDNAAVTTKTARESENVVLECKFPPSPVESKWYWTRTKPGGKYDTVAFGDEVLISGYSASLLWMLSSLLYSKQIRTDLQEGIYSRVNYDKNAGIYDLNIAGTSYERDNGVFECRNVAKESREYIHNSTTNLVILFEPGRPVLTPLLPNVTESKPFQLACESVGGSPPPEMTWLKNGEIASDDSIEFTPALDRDTPTVSVITVIPEKDDDNSEYTCTVWNQAIDKEETMQVSTKINVNYYPRVSVGPENPVRVERGEPATLECTVDSKPNVQDVKWLRNGKFISTNFRHLIQRAGLENAGPYICSADNSLGKVVEQELELDVLYAPEVTVPRLKEFSENEDVIVHCNISANPKAHAVVWTKEGDEKFRQEGTMLSLSASEGAAVNNGVYTCTATNTLHATGRQPVQRQGSASIQVAVKHAPGTTFITPEKPTVMEGDRITLKCGANPPGYPQPTYTWSREASLTSVLATGESFTIDGARLDSGGRYFCRPNNIAGYGSIGETVLNVYQPPRMDNKLLSTIEKRSGDTGYLVTCSAVGKPKPQITWYKDDVEINPEESDLFQISVNVMDKKDAFNVISTLNFIGPGRLGKRKLMATDRGNYMCKFHNEVGQANSTMLLRIQHSPVVRHQHNKVAADLNEQAIIPCRMQSYPAPRFEWSKEHNVLIDRQGYNQQLSTVEQEDDIYEGRLEIARVEESNYGQYACKASNNFGAQKTLITLQPRGKPERPDTPEAEDVRPDSVLLKWREGFNGGFNETTYNVQLTDDNGGLSKDIDCRRKNPCNISGLNQYTKYSFKVRAVNIRGFSPYSRELSITTAVDVAKIPKAEHIFFETSSSQVSFNVVNYPLGLVAKIELENPDKSFRPHAKLGMNDRTFGQMIIEDPAVTGVRVRLCLTSDDTLCGEYGFAEIVEVRQSPYTNGALPMEGVIAIVIFAGILAIAAIGLVIKCCFCSTPNKPMKLSKEDITGPNNRLQNNFKNYAMDSKGVSAKDTADSPDLIKSQMYGQYNFSNNVPGAQVPAGYDQSSSNSHNGGSVNSQESLWNVKHPMPAVDPGMNGFVTASGYYPDGQAGGNAAYGQAGQYGGMEGYGAGQYGGMDQVDGHPGGYPGQYGVANNYGQQQYNYEEYTHYPHPEEYINERNRAYLSQNGDQYAMPNKSRNRLESDYSAYGDVSHGHDPSYNAHDISAELRAQTEGVAITTNMDGGPAYGQDNMMMAPAPEGYSTPSRRVIREIIV